MDNDNDGCFMAIIAVLCAAALSATIAYDQGKKAGAIAHHDGKVTVVDLPDGTRDVFEVKEPKP